MPTTNEATDICRCGHSKHQHVGKVGRCSGGHGQCRCSVFDPLPSQLQEGEQRRQVTED